MDPALMQLRLGEVDHLIVSSAEIATQFLKTHDIVFASRPSLLATEIGCYGNTDIACAPYGEYWRQLRRICALELLSSKRVQSLRYTREEEVLEQCRWIAMQEGSTVNLTEKIGNTNYDIMMRAALGKKTDEQACGRRICPGIAFGIANIEIQLAMLLYHFDWILPDGIKPDDLDMAEVSGMSGRKKCNLCVIPVVRRPFM